METIEIWEPKYSTNEVLISTRKVRPGDNYITFTKAEYLKGKVYKVSPSVIREAKVQKNGKGTVYCVPLTSLELYEPVTN